jgi:hypothetical protein
MKTDLSLILSTLSLAATLGLGVITTALLAAFLAGVLVGRSTQRGP